MCRHISLWQWQIQKIALRVWRGSKGCAPSRDAWGKSVPRPQKLEYQCILCNGKEVFVNTHIHTHPFNGALSGTTPVSRYQQAKTNLDFTWSKRQWVAVASAQPYACLHLAPNRLPRQHLTTQFFTGRTPFLPPNQQRQSTEGTNLNLTYTQI